MPKKNKLNYISTKVDGIKKTSVVVSGTVYTNHTHVSTKRESAYFCWPTYKEDHTTYKRGWYVDPWDRIELLY